MQDKRSNKTETDREGDLNEERRYEVTKARLQHCTETASRNVPQSIQKHSELTTELIFLHRSLCEERAKCPQVSISSDRLSRLFH